jgi:hypothetical protein
MLRHAIATPEVAAVSKRDPDILDPSAEAIDHRPGLSHCYIHPASTPTSNEDSAKAMLKRPM